MSGSIDPLPLPEILLRLDQDLHFLSPESGEMVATLAKIIKEDIYKKAYCTECSFIMYVGPIIRSRTCCHSLRQGRGQGYLQSHGVLGERSWQSRKSVPEIRGLTRLPFGSSPSTAGRNSPPRVRAGTRRGYSLATGDGNQRQEMPNEALPRQLLTVALLTQGKPEH